MLLTYNDRISLGSTAQLASFSVVIATRSYETFMTGHSHFVLLVPNKERALLAELAPVRANIFFNNHLYRERKPHSTY